jgi:hypothetical protein
VCREPRAQCKVQYTTAHVYGIQICGRAILKSSESRETVLHSQILLHKNFSVVTGINKLYKNGRNLSFKVFHKNVLQPDY